MRAWRSLTGGAPVLVACSGGADSSALALALGAARAPITLITVRHHQRPRAQTDADIASVRALGERLGVPVVALELPERTPATEAAMRTARYGLLASAAQERGCGYVATAHHADDQLESMLLALARGTGLHGLRGIAPRRRIAGTAVRLIRPMLGVTRAQARAICDDAGWAWHEDPTNHDTRYRRAALRASALPALEAIAPGAALRATRTAALLRELAGVIDDQVARVIAAAERTPDGLRWPRAALAGERPALVMGAIRAAAAAHADGAGRDRLTLRALAPLARAVRDGSTERRTFALRMGVRAHVTAHEVRLVWPAGAER